MAAWPHLQFNSFPHCWATDAYIPAIIAVMDAAPVRAMYTRPNWTRRGIGRLVVELCESAARRAGFSRTQLMATLSGEALYLARGYRPVERLKVDTAQGVTVALVRMEKTL